MSSMRAFYQAACSVWFLLQWRHCAAVEGGTYELMSRLLGTYDPATPPPPDGKSTEIQIGLYIHRLSMNTKTMDLSINMFLRESWRDPRLKFNATPNLNSIRLYPPHTQIWLPDVFVKNTNTMQGFQLPTDASLCRIRSDGSVWFVRQLSGTFDCPMRLERFPFDKQACAHTFESFGYSKEVLTLEWMSNAVDLAPTLQLLEFTLVDFILFDCSVNFTTGSFPCLQVQLILHRELGYYVLTVFAPMALTVTVSWVGLWLHTGATTARAVVGFMSLLILTLLSGSARSALPPVSYVTALDVWIFGCCIFVVLTLLELGLVNLLSGTRAGQLREKENENKGGKASKCDKCCRVGFPLAFFIFVAAYFVTYKAT